MIFGTLAFSVALSLSTSTYSINYKILDSEANICVDYLMKGYPIKRKQIEERLNFVTNADLSNKEYAEPNRFKTLYRKIRDDRENTNERLLNFVNGCRIIYEESGNLATKIAIPFLIESAGKKYTSFLRQWKRKRDLEWQQENELRYSSHESAEALFKAFLNADKDIALPFNARLGNKETE